MNRINRSLLLNTIGLLITTSVLLAQRYIDIPDNIALIACGIAFICVISGIIISIKTIRKRKNE